MRLNIFKFFKLKKGDYCREEFYKDDPIPAYRYSLLDYIFDVNKF